MKKMEEAWLTFLQSDDEEVPPLLRAFRDEFRGWWLAHKRSKLPKCPVCMEVIDDGGPLISCAVCGQQMCGTDCPELNYGTPFSIRSGKSISHCCGNGECVARMEWGHGRERVNLSRKSILRYSTLGGE